MDFTTFATNAKAIEVEAEAIAETINSQHKETIACFVGQITNLSNFLNDTRNTNALNDYDKKAEENKENCPLDILCKDICTRLAAIEPLLTVSTLDYFRQEKQPIMGANEQHTVRDNQNNFYSLTNRINQLLSSNLLPAFEVLKYLSGHNKTLIILGANGSGKTSFTKHLKKVETHVKVIPANKPLTSHGHFASCYDATISKVNDELFDQGASQDLLLKLIVSLCSQHDDCARISHAGGAKTKSTYEKIKEIFDDFFEVKLDCSTFSKRELNGVKDGGTPYPFNNMSDGERVAFFYIATTIMAPSQSFIVVDEPENHLNPAVYNKIWDKLMAARSDCQFIFISHTMEFINARTDFELVKIKDFIYPNKFNFEFLGNSLEDLPYNFIVEIVGSRKQILFCEGTKTDYDYKVYEVLFGGKYTIVPTGNCTSVKNSVIACNMHAKQYSLQSAVGIIDSDTKSDVEIARLQENNIFTIACNEIEMLLLDEIIFKKVLKQLFKPENDFSSFKDAFFRKICERKHHIIKRIVKTQIDEKLQTSIIDDRNNKTQSELAANLNQIFNEINVNTLWTECETKIDNMLSLQDYNAALKYCCLEHNEIIVGVGKPFVSDYATIALGVLKNDSELAQTIKEKYFEGFDF